MEHTGTPSLAVRRVGERATAAAQDLARQVDSRLERVTGRRPAAWPAELQRIVRARPLSALGAAIAAGYLLGKIAWRR